MNTLDYLNQNSLRNYPIQDGASRLSSDGLFTIPNTLIVDVSLSAGGVNSDSLYISKIAHSSTAVNIEISVDGGSVFGIFYITLPNSNSNFDVALTAGVGYPDAVGVITIGSTSDLATLPTGEFVFAVEDTKFLAHCATLGNLGVTRISFIDAKGNNYTLTGHVIIQANSNLQFKADGNTVYLNAGENLGLNKQCPAESVPVKTINGVAPDSTGNFSLISDPNSCLSLEPIQYGTLISDACGKPCLGCDDINTLTTRVNTLESEIYSVRDFITNLQAAISQANALIGYQCQCDQ